MKRFCIIFSILLLYLHSACSYQEYYLNDLCPNNPLKKAFNKLMDNKPEIRLGDGDSSAAIVRQNWNSSSFKRFDECSFNVDTPRDDRKWTASGTYITIKRLNLRRHGLQGECIDYVRFKFGDRKTSKLCGQIDATSLDYEQYNFDASVRSGPVKVYISIDKLRPLSRIEDTLDVEIVFTSYTTCGGVYNTKCPSAFDNTCVYDGFRGDNIYNCPPPICSDESACPRSTTHDHPDIVPNKSNIVISAITSLIFTLVAVGSCFWICWKIKDCLVGEATNVPSNQRTERQNRSQTANNIVNEGSVSLNLTGASTREPTSQSAYYRPSAPPIEDKSDLPPSYETLYPDGNGHK